MTDNTKMIDHRRVARAIVTALLPIAEDLAVQRGKTLQEAWTYVLELNHNLVDAEREIELY